MPWISGEKLQALHDQIEFLQLRVGDYEALGPHIALASLLRNEIIQSLKDCPSLTAGQIGDLAFQLVLEDRLEEARGDVISQYEQAHRDSLYQRLLDHVKVSEGESIFETVRANMEADTAVMLELHESARIQVASRAKGVAEKELTAEQVDKIKIEGERQILLDRLDLELAIGGELDLHRDDISELLQHGDELEITYKDGQRSSDSFTLTWYEDAMQKSGWVLQGKIRDSLQCSGSSYGTSLRDKYFIEICTILPDLTEGSQHYQPNFLRTGSQLGFIQVVNGEEKFYSFTASQNWSDLFGTLIKTDFRTKALNFDH